MQNWKDVNALYRLLDDVDVTFEGLIQPHFQQTHREVETETVVLLVQDTREIDLTHRGNMAGMGQIGNANGRGMLLQTVLAVVPQTRAILGCLTQKPFVRGRAPQKEQRSQRRHREQRETEVWMQMGEQIGSFPSTSMIVPVGDRGADRFPFFRACLLTHPHFVVRAAQNRSIEHEEQAIDHLLDQVRAWTSQGEHSFLVPASQGRTGRQTQLSISFGPVSILPPCNDPRGSKAPLPLWVVRVWEREGPEGEDPLEWILLTSLPSTHHEQAWQGVDWSRCRWIVEDSHQCLKTGCRMEERPVQSSDRLKRVLGLLSPVAVRLLQLRGFAQETPDRPASEVLETDVVALVAVRTTQSPSSLTLGAFWTEIARMGGYLARSGDGPPGWKTVWKGWLQLQTLLEGVHLASHLLL